MITKFKLFEDEKIENRMYISTSYNLKNNNINELINNIKKFENKNDEPVIGDYVILKDDTYLYNNEFKNYSNFINNNIGRIIKIHYKNDYIPLDYDIEYDNIPDNIKDCFAKHVYDDKIQYYELSRPEHDIISTFKNKEDAELFLSARKYNL